MEHWIEIAISVIGGGAGVLGLIRAGAPRIIAFVLRRKSPSWINAQGVKIGTSITNAGRAKSGKDYEILERTVQAGLNEFHAGINKGLNYDDAK